MVEICTTATLYRIFTDKNEVVNLNASCCEDGLPTFLQQALDSIRVIDNESVHPGQVDMRDDTHTASKPFWAMNMIAERMIRDPKQAEALFGTLLEKELARISKRDLQ